MDLNAAIKLRQQQFTENDLQTVERLREQAKSRHTEKSRDDLLQEAFEKVSQLSPEQLIYAFAIALST